MSWGTAIALLVVLGCVGLALRSMIKDKKAGKSWQCGADCSKCGGHCARSK
ncbi:MAG: FeoB-associated Cys-rich membrane protein [Lachnospiraceae bacterium]|nr:FeoB-associated Cys-rich membrane protein [Lachnospiraceae bacterium]